MNVLKRIAIASAVGAMTVALVAVPGVAAKKGAKDVGGTVSVTATPSTVDSTVTTVTATGNVKANSSCRKARTVRFSYVDSTGVSTPLTETAVTKPNGDYSAVLPKPTATGPATVTLVASVDQAARKLKGKGKKKGHAKGKARKFNCLALTGQTTVTVAGELPPAP